MVSIAVTDEILIRSYSLNDAAILYAAIHKNREHLRPWLNWVDSTTSEQDSLEFIKLVQSQIDKQEGLALGIFFKDEIIGGIGMLEWNHHLKKANVGYWIDKKHQGKGVLSQCLEKFIDFLFKNLDLNKIEIHFVSNNKRSARIAEKFNAKIEGILRDNYIVNGAYKDLVIAGILKKEWQLKKH